MRKWAVVNAAGEVVHGFDAEQEFIEEFTERIVERDDVTTPDWWDDGIEFHDVTDLEVRPTLGFKHNRGRFTAPPPPPPPPPPTPEEQERAADRQFVSEMRTKLRKGGELTQQERDRMLALSLPV